MTYTVEYLMDSAASNIKYMPVVARNKFDAYDKAVYELIPAMVGYTPYAAWVASVTYNNGNYKAFNTSAGNPV